MLAKKITFTTITFLTITSYMIVGRPSPTHAEQNKNSMTVLYKKDTRPTVTTIAPPTTTQPNHLKQIGWMDYTSWPDWHLWKCTMRVETGSRWNYISPGGKFRGAFGIYRGTWQSHYNIPWIKNSYPLAEQAPAWVQIVAARSIRSHVGSSQWGGLRYCGG